MRRIFLRGLAEGLAGCSSVLANDFDEVFAMFPALAGMRSKLTVGNDTISGFCACDG